MSRTFVLGDVHGAHRALTQVFERSGFDFENDRLIFLGDVADGWPEVRACMDELLRVRHLTFILGNHDEWFRMWVQHGWRGQIWTMQGGKATLASYGDSRENVPESHRELLNTAVAYHIEDNRCFMHAGLPEGARHPISATDDELRWARELWYEALNRHQLGNESPITGFAEVFIGHTATSAISDRPVHVCEVWNVDQGAGWSGKLTMMDVDTKEYWQSDNVLDLYPDVKGRAA